MKMGRNIYYEYPTGTAPVVLKRFNNGYGFELASYGAPANGQTDVAHGARCIRVDGTGTNDALYVNTAASGVATTWTLLNIN